MNDIVKKNDFATFLVYLAMFAIALLVGLLVISPAIQANNITTPTAIVIVVISVLVGVIFNSACLELLHMLGAAAGGYKILSVCILSLTFKKKGKDGKRFAFGSFDGLTGETKIEPKDVEKSSPSGIVFFPMLGYLLEVIILLILSACLSSYLAWFPIACYVILAIGGMIFVYNDFPAHLDSVTDGYLLILLTKPINRIAYNQILLAEHSENKKEALASLPIYEELSDFTATLNTLAAYRMILKGDNEGALQIFMKISDADKNVSKSIRQEALCQRLAMLLMLEKKQEAKDYYEGMDDDTRRYIASLATLPALRCYALVAGIVEGSDTEVSWAFDKVERLEKKVSGVVLEGESKLLNDSYFYLKKMHPDWDIQADFIDHQNGETKKEDENK